MEFFKVQPCMAARALSDLYPSQLTGLLGLVEYAVGVYQESHSLPTPEYLGDCPLAYLNSDGELVISEDEPCAYRLLFAVFAALIGGSMNLKGFVTAIRRGVEESGVCNYVPILDEYCAPYPGGFIYRDEVLRIVVVFNKGTGRFTGFYEDFTSQSPDCATVFADIRRIRHERYGFE